MGAVCPGAGSHLFHYMHHLLFRAPTLNLEGSDVLLGASQGHNTAYSHGMHHPSHPRKGEGGSFPTPTAFPTPR